MKKRLTENQKLREAILQFKKTVLMFTIIDPLEKMSRDALIEAMDGLLKPKEPKK